MLFELQEKLRRPLFFPSQAGSIWIWLVLWRLEVCLAAFVRTSGRDNFTQRRSEAARQIKTLPASVINMKSSFSER